MISVDFVLDMSVVVVLFVEDSMVYFVVCCVCVGVVFGFFGYVFVEIYLVLMCFFGDNCLIFLVVVCVI